RSGIVFAHLGIVSPRESLEGNEDRGITPWWSHAHRLRRLFVSLEPDGPIATSPGPRSSAQPKTKGLASNTRADRDRMEPVSGRSSDRSGYSDLADRCIRDPRV